MHQKEEEKGYKMIYNSYSWSNSSRDKIQFKLRRTLLMHQPNNKCLEVAALGATPLKLGGAEGGGSIE